MVTTRKRAREVAAQQADLTPTPSLVAPPATNTDDSDDVDDDDDAEERILSETYDGAKDAAGRPHGAGRLTVAFLRGRHRGRNTFQGHFKHGDKHGPGEWRFDAGTDEESTLSGPFLADALEGDGRYTSSDGSYTLGPYRGGILHGRVEEFSPTGTLVFTGQYRDNARNGEGTLYHTHGGVYSGQWRDGLFHGASNIYTYPPATPLPFSFRGQWEDGHMTACRLFLGDQPADDIVYSQDESELGGPIAEQPMLMDAYEQQCCFVKQSSLGPQAGEGLFARIDLPPGVVVSFYNGIKQEEHISESNHWDLNGNCIALDEAAGVDIDVPAPYSSLTSYCASLGHKANHAFDPTLQNAEYAHCLHPRFGWIKSIRVRDGMGGVKAGEELLVDYGFDKRGGPQWWKEGRRQMKRAAAQR